MKELLRSRTTLVWALLVLATLLSWQLGHGLGFGSAEAAGTAILGVTFLKVRWVMLDFMELRDAPNWLRHASQIWILVIAAALVSLFLMPAL